MANENMIESGAGESSPQNKRAHREKKTWRAARRFEVGGAEWPRIILKKPARRSTKRKSALARFEMTARIMCAKIL